MKQRHRRKAKQRELARPIRSRAWRARANAWGRSGAVLWMSQPDFEASYPRCDSADAFAYSAQAWRQVQDAMGVPNLNVSMVVDNRTIREVQAKCAEAERRLINMVVYGTSHPEFYL